MKRSEQLLYGLLFVGLCVLLYQGALRYPLVFDDEIYLVSNPIFKRWENFPAILSAPRMVANLAAVHALDPDVSTNFLLRPLTYLTFFWNHLADGLNPAGYRLVNMGIHLINALLVVQLSTLVLRGASFAGHRSTVSARWTPVLAGLLFLVHPLQIESVTYVIQRATALCALFYLAGLVCHLRFSQQGGSVWWRAFSVVCVLLAMFCKESAFTAPVVAVALEFCVYRNGLQNALKRASWLLVLLPVLPLMLLGVALAKGMDPADAARLAQHGGASAGYWFEYALSQPQVWLRYLGLFIWPAGQNVDPDPSLVRSVWSALFWAPALALVALSGVLWILQRRPGSAFAGSAALFGMGWFALTVAPDSSVVPLPDLMAEHRSYLPLVGLCFAGAAWFTSLPLRGVALGFGGGLLVGGLAFATVHRNRVWASPEILWRNACEGSPGKVRPWLNLGGACFEAGKLEEAEKAYTHSVSVTPTPVGFANLAVVLKARGLSERAMEVAQEGLRHRPTDYDHLLLAQLGDCLYKKGRLREAAEALREAVALRPGYVEAVALLARVHVQLGEGPEAVRILEQTLQLRPGEPLLLSALGEARQPPPFRLKLGR